MMADKEVNLGGRPDKFTPERRQAILDSIASYIPYELAANANGIGERTLYNWLLRGEEEEAQGIHSEYVQFWQDLKQVEQNKIKNNLEVIENKPERWQANAWILERRWWKWFSPNAAVVEFNRKLDELERQGGKQDVEALKREAKEATEK
jgi:transposase